ncbi:hypothetical protein LPJ66_003222, partial [Kickxella alabastrina]
MGACDAQCVHNVQLAWLNNNARSASLILRLFGSDMPVWRHICRAQGSRMQSSKKVLFKLMAVASRLLSNAADSVWRTQEEDLTGVGGGMAWLWAAELPQTVAQYVVDRRCRVGGSSQAGVPGHLRALSQRYFEGRVPRASETEYSMILSGLDSAHLLLHLLDLGLKANKLDIRTALASIRDTTAVVALVGGIDRDPAAAQLTAGL